MAARDDFDAGQRLRRVRREGDGRAVADLHDLDHRQRREILALRVGEPFVRGAMDPHHHARFRHLLVEVLRVPSPDRLGDCGAIRRSAEDIEEAGEMLRIKAGRRHHPPVLRLEKGEGQRIVEQEGQLQLAPVDRRPPGEAARQIVLRIDDSGRLFLLKDEAHIGHRVVDGLAQIDRKVLAFAGALAPDRRRAKPRGHRRDRHAGADAKMTADDRVAAGEGHRAASVGRAPADLVHELAKLGLNVEGAVRRLRRCRHRRAARSQRRSDRCKTRQADELPPACRGFGHHIPQPICPQYPIS